MIMIMIVVVCAHLVRTRAESLGGIVELASFGEEIDEAVRGEIRGGTGVETGVGAETVDDGLAEAGARVVGAGCNHHLHHFVAVDFVAHGYGAGKFAQPQVTCQPPSIKALSGIKTTKGRPGKWDVPSETKNRSDERTYQTRPKTREALVPPKPKLLARE